MGGILAKQAANDATSNDATIMKQMQSIIKSYEDASSQLTVLKQSTVAGSEEFVAFAESYSVRASALQRVLDDLSTNVPSAPAMTIAEKDAAKILVVSQGFASAGEALQKASDDLVAQTTAGVGAIKASLPTKKTSATGEAAASASADGS